MTTNPDPRDFTRRRVLQGTALGAVAIPAVGLLGACATSGSDSSEDVKNSGDAENPFNVDGSKPVDLVIFDGGFKTKYADEKTGHISLYNKKFPKSKSTMTAEEDIAATQQPRFADGEPPDLMDDSGAQKLDIGTLVADGMLAELTPLLEAPSIDDPKVKVKDSLAEGTLKFGTFTDPKGDSKVFALPYAVEAWSIWFDQALFDEKEWPVPTTWEEMISLCADIKKEGIAPWTYAGKHPYYLWDMLFTLACRHGGRDVSVAIDNLEPKAWDHESVVMAAEALYSLQDKGYILEGTPGIDHIDSQTKWNHGEAAFLPCGSWVANEQGDEAPKSFVYNTIGVPGFKGGKQPELAWWAGGEPFVVPAQAANKEGGYELLRIMLSKEGSKVFSDATRSPSILAKQTIEDPAAKAVAALNTGGENVYRPQIADWYLDFKEKAEPALADLMAGEKTPKEFLKAAQEAADKVAGNDDIDKYKQEY